jgi:hypothetical protein
MAFLSCTLRTNGTPRTAQVLQVPGVGRAGPLEATIWSFVADAVLAASGEEWTIPAGTQALPDDGTTALDLSAAAYLVYALLGSSVLHALRQELVLDLVEETDICPLAWVDAHHDLAPLGLLGALRGVRSRINLQWLFLADRADYVPMDNPAGGAQIENPGRDAYSVQHHLQPYPQVDYPGAYTQGPYDPGLSANRIACRAGYLLMIDHAGGLLTRPVNDPTRTRRPLLPLLYSDSSAPLPHALGVAADADAWWLLAEYPGGGGKTRGLHILRSNADFPYDSAHWQLRQTLVMPAPATGSGISSNIGRMEPYQHVPLAGDVAPLRAGSSDDTWFAALLLRLRLADGSGVGSPMDALLFSTREDAIVTLPDGQARTLRAGDFSLVDAAGGTNPPPSGIYALAVDGSGAVTFTFLGTTAPDPSGLLVRVDYTAPPDDSTPPHATAQVTIHFEDGTRAYGIGAGGTCLVQRSTGAAPGLVYDPVTHDHFYNVVPGLSLLAVGIAPYFDETTNVLVGAVCMSGLEHPPNQEGGALHSGRVVLPDGTTCGWGTTILPMDAGQVQMTIYFLPGVGLGAVSETGVPDGGIALGTLSYTGGDGAWHLVPDGMGHGYANVSLPTSPEAATLVGVPTATNPTLLPTTAGADLAMPDGTVIHTGWLNTHTPGNFATTDAIADPRAYLACGLSSSLAGGVSRLQVTFYGAAEHVGSGPSIYLGEWDLDHYQLEGLSGDNDFYESAAGDGQATTQVDGEDWHLCWHIGLISTHTTPATPGSPRHVAWNYVTCDDPYTTWTGVDVPLPPVWAQVLTLAVPAPSPAEGVSYAAVRFGAGSPAPVYVSTNYADDGRGIDQFGVPLYTPGGVWDGTPWTPSSPTTPTTDDLLRVWAVCTDGPGGHGIYIIDTAGTSFFRGAGHGTSYSQITADLVPPAPDYVYYWAHIVHHGEVVVHGDGDALWGAYAVNSTITRLFGPDAFPTARTVADGSAVTAVTRLLDTAPAAPLEWTGPVCTPDGQVCLLRTTINVASVPAGQSVSFIAYTDVDVHPTNWWIDLVDETDHQFVQFNRGGPGGVGFPITYDTPGTHQLRAVLSSQFVGISPDAVWSDPLIVDWT